MGSLIPWRRTRIKEEPKLTTPLAEYIKRGQLAPDILKTGTRVGWYAHSTAGDHSVDWIGFKPKFVLFFCTATGGTHQIASWGFAFEGDRYCTYLRGDSVDASYSGGNCVFLYKDGSNFIVAYNKSMDKDGFTLTWSLTGTLTANVTVFAVE